jgi:hypothetical protein
VELRISGVRFLRFLSASGDDHLCWITSRKN